MSCARCEEWQRICENLESQITGLREDTADRIEALEAVLRKYSTHTSDCGWNYGHDCDCGIVEIRAALAPEQDK